MRIISGKLRGRSLASVSDSGLRPAMGKTREALFSMLEARGMEWTGARVLDLFAGSGSLGFEALSRGADLALLVENGRQPLGCLARNAQALELADQARVIDADVQRYLRKPPPIPFNLVFIDPPYRRGLAKTVLERLVANMWLAPQAFVAAEVEKGLTLPRIDGLEPETDRMFGQTQLHIWKYQ